MTALMIQGTASDVGKSVVVAGLCRLLARKGIRVAPFKPQNMSNNAAVVAGGEIGRAQALQAMACGIEATVEMNPVLIKPESDGVAQLIVRGQLRGQLQARHFLRDREPLLEMVLSAFQSLQDSYDVVLVEGAGCSAEPNLRQGDIANMGFANAADLPVWLLGDIDKGGVFAALQGCLAILPTVERDRVCACLINRFRGHRALLQDAIDYLESHTGKPVAAVLPYLSLSLPEEDSYRQQQNMHASAALRIVVVAYPRMSNHDDFDPLRMHAGVQLDWAHTPEQAVAADVLILPGSKHVYADFKWFQEQGFVEVLKRHLRYGGKVLGLCGGLQMLGESIDGDAQTSDCTGLQGLGLLPIRTQMHSEKTLTRVYAMAQWPKACMVSAYEIHHGQSTVMDGVFPFSAYSDDEQVWGSYLHGLFVEDDFRLAWLQAMGGELEQGLSYRQQVEDSLDLLADTLETELRADFLHSLC